LSQPEPRVLTIAGDQPFAENFTAGLMARSRVDHDPLALAGMTVFLPTRRAVRNFTDTFARLLGGAALLPRFRPLGDVDEDELLLRDDGDTPDLPPAISPIRRRLLLAMLVRRWDERRHRDALGFAQASALAQGLAALLDEFHTQRCDLGSVRDLAPKALAAHWEDVVSLLDLLSEEWPNLLAAERAVDPADRRDRALSRLTQTLDPEATIIAAGSTGSIPATGELLKAIAHLPHGMVVLPGLDQELDAESWEKLDPGHPQYGMKQLLRRIGIEREQVKPWSAEHRDSPRQRLLREILRPPPTTDAWLALAQSGGGDIAEGLRGLSLVDAADPAEEASIVALALREALETPQRTAALVTPDRGLARRVAAELKRWDIDIDDSAGTPLAHTPPGNFLCLLAEAADSAFAPVPFLALLKHPLCAVGDAAHFRRQARALDIALRGALPDAGLDGIARRIADKPAFLQHWFAELAEGLRPFGDALADERIDPAKAVALHLEAAAAISDARQLWRGDAGERARDFVEELLSATAGLPKIEPRAYAPLFRELVLGIAVRPRYGKHPRLAILGPLEARLLSFDRVVLAGLNEGTWPQAAATDPWFSRPMRAAIGLEPPERSIGLAAHDFATLAARGDVLLTRAQKTDGAPMVPSRWVERLLQLTSGLGLSNRLAPRTDYRAIHALQQEPAPANRIKRPAPTPPVEARPKSLSVTEIETWLRDPYAIYARRILGLEKLDPHDAEIGALERGMIVHDALERFVKEFPHGPPEGSELRLIAIADELFQGLPRSVVALWRPRFLKAARWFAGLERERRAQIHESHLEVRGNLVLGDFALRGRADRIDLLRAGGAAVVDYKTGAPPSDKQVRELIAPQLPLEAAMLERGAFDGVAPTAAAELVYIRFAGGARPGELRVVNADAHALAAEALAKLVQRIAEFAQTETPYASRVRPFRADIEGDYDHLARVREWSVIGWAEAES